MRTPMYQRAPTMAIPSTMMLHPNYPFFVSSFDSESNESDDQFDFTINREFLLDPNDIVIGEMIGEGTYSIVYKGLFKKHVPVAVKIMQPSRTATVSIEQKENFQKEVMLLSKIKYDNIVKFVGACIEPRLMIVTELLEGGTLQKFMWDSRPSPLDMKTSLSFALDIARAMEFLHSNGIIHRDLKPSNLLVTSDLKQVKLADFGLAREEAINAMTSEVGTYRWMAPEMFSHEPLKIGEKKHYDHKVDVYSFALVFWEFLTNKTPFSGFTYMSMPYFSSKNERPSLRNIPDGAVSILESCWAEDSNARPEFKEIIVLLTNLLRSLCLVSSSFSTLSENLDDIDDSESIISLRDYSFQVLKQEVANDKMKKKSKKKKVVKKMILPFIKMFKKLVCTSHDKRENVRKLVR